MRKLIVTEFVSLDGVMEAPGGEPGYAHSGWVGEFMSDQESEYKLNEVLAAEAHLLGRVTYESFAGAWPQREGEFADKVNEMPKYVVSTTLTELDWNNSTLLEGDAAESIAELKETEGGDILVAGSRTLVHTLMDAELIDEYRLMTFPVILNSGLRLFPERPDKIELKLIDARTFESGVQVHTYGPVP